MSELFQIRWIPIRGDSMWPALRDGDRARWEPLSGPVREGDVLVVRSGGAFVAHRVISTEPVLLRGDNCVAVDPPVNPDAILGRVIEVERRGARVPRWDLGPSRLGRLRLRVKRFLAGAAR